MKTTKNKKKEEDQEQKEEENAKKSNKKKVHNLTRYPKRVSQGPQGVLVRVATRRILGRHTLVGHVEVLQTHIGLQDYRQSIHAGRTKPIIGQTQVPQA